MKTERLMQSGILNNGEPRHYSSWSIPEVPKLNISGRSPLGEALDRRQKAHAPKINLTRISWMQIINALRKV